MVSGLLCGLVSGLCRDCLSEWYLEGHLGTSVCPLAPRNRQPLCCGHSDGPAEPAGRPETQSGPKCIHRPCPTLVTCLRPPCPRGSSALGHTAFFQVTPLVRNLEWLLMSENRCFWLSLVCRWPAQAPAGRAWICFWHRHPTRPLGASAHPASLRTFE